MDGPTLKSLPPFFSIGYREKRAVLQAMNRPLSGYLGGCTPRGGYWTDKLEAMWTDVFECLYAIPCNSATSGLLAACMAAGIGPRDIVWTTPYSMSATAACALVLGARIKFIDIEPIRYGIDPELLDSSPLPKAIIVTNLFGHPAYLTALRSWCDKNKVFMIEDNAQAIFAKEGAKYAGTIGHIGVFSLNVHKHIQCGEGGIICTNEPDLSSDLRGAINHGELSLCTTRTPGLNLRMTEPTAAIACAQLSHAEQIMDDRRKLARALNTMILDVPWIKGPLEDFGCKHSYYVWAGAIKNNAKLRHQFTRELQMRGFPLRAGYSKLLTHVFLANDSVLTYHVPVAHRIEHEEIITFEVCAYDPKSHHLKRMGEIVEYVAETIDREDQWKSQGEESQPISPRT